MPYFHDPDIIADNGTNPVNLRARIADLEGGLEATIEAIEALTERVTALEGDTEGDTEDGEMV